MGEDGGDNLDKINFVRDLQRCLVLVRQIQHIYTMSDAIVSYAALILSDAGLDITSENLLTLTKAAGASVDKVS